MPPKLDKTSATERIQLVTTASWVKALDEWRRQQPDLPNRSEAIRRIVEAHLAAKKD